jgi:hypothetical protein
MRKHLGDNRIHCDLDLLARRQILHADGSRFDVAVTGD